VALEKKLKAAQELSENFEVIVCSTTDFVLYFLIITLIFIKLLSCWFVEICRLEFIHISG